MELKSNSQSIRQQRRHLDNAVNGRQNLGSRELFVSAAQKIHEEAFEMAKKIAEAKGKKKEKAEFKGFANIELNSDEKSEMREWILRVEDVQVELDEILSSYYKMTVTRSDATGGYQASLFCTDTQSPNAGYILSAFAPSWFDAVACLAYKHAIKCEGVWDVDAAKAADAWG